MLYGEESRGHVMEVHQELKRRDFLTPWCDVPEMLIIFVSIVFVSLSLSGYHRVGSSRSGWRSVSSVVSCD